MNPGLVVCMNTDMDLFELILFSTIIMLTFVCFVLTAVFFTDNNLFLIFLSLTFGLVGMPISSTVGLWWTQLKGQERDRLNISLDEGNKAPSWLFLDFGLKGNTRLFRIMSIITVIFAVVSLIRYVMGKG
jgi:hypothetical protein